MTDKEKLAEQYNAFCEAFGIVKPQAILEACVALDKIVELVKVEATKWHYPSKGEYPTDGEQVFVAWTSEGSYDVVKFRHCLWGMKLSPPYAWQYIEPPKEEK